MRQAGEKAGLEPEPVEDGTGLVQEVDAAGAVGVTTCARRLQLAESLADRLQLPLVEQRREHDVAFLVELPALLVRQRVGPDAQIAENLLHRHGHSSHLQSRILRDNRLFSLLRRLRQQHGRRPPSLRARRVDRLYCVPSV
jgi:hypothetical protein